MSLFPKNSRLLFKSETTTGLKQSNRFEFLNIDLKQFGESKKEVERNGEKSAITLIKPLNTKNLSKSRNIYLAKRVQTAKQRSKVNEILQIQDTENYLKGPIPKQSVFTSKTMKLKPEMVKNPKERNIIGTISNFYDQKQKQKTKFTKQWKMTKKDTLCSERGLRVSRAFSEINDRETFNFRFSSSNHRAKAKKEKMKEFTLFNNK